MGHYTRHKIINISSSSPGNSSQPIWLDNVVCEQVESCIATCQSCPLGRGHECGHSDDIVGCCRHAEDVTVECSIGEYHVWVSTVDMYMYIDMYMYMDMYMYIDMYMYGISMHHGVRYDTTIVLEFGCSQL